MKKITVAWLLLTVMINFVACKGPQGDVGPQGAAGLTGATGAAGAPGAAGAQGPPGAANLIVSSWTAIKATDWKSDNDPLYFYRSIEDMNITQAIIDKGLVMAYYRNSAQKSVVLSLPSVTDKLSIGYFFQLNQGKGLMNFDLSYFMPRRVPIDFDIEVRWIIVPPSPGGRLGAIDWTDYAEVKRVVSTCRTK